MSALLAMFNFLESGYFRRNFCRYVSAFFCVPYRGLIDYVSFMQRSGKFVGLRLEI